MRRFIILLIALTVTIATDVSPGSAAPPDQVQRGNDPRGVVLDGLVRGAASGPCGGTFELAHRDKAGQALCTHGPDPAPDGVDVRQRRGPDPGVAAEPTAPSAGVAAAVAGVGCYGNGSDGYRVQLIYARASNVADRYASFAASFAQWAADLDAMLDASAAETGGTRHVRFLTDPSCNPIVDRVTFTTSGDDNFGNTMSELRAQGYNRSDRKYLVWVDANVYCGIAQVYWDDSQNPAPGANMSNGNSQVAGEVARVDNGCWGMGTSVEAHELMHTLGGVQTSAPNSTANNHCRDDQDRMCYADGPGVTVVIKCQNHENRFDCNHDDYFHTNPPAGSYLATHWNTANSAFLAGSTGGAPPPSSATTASPTSAEPGDTVIVSGSGAQPSVSYGLRMGSTAANCGNGLRLGGAVNSDASGNIPPTSRIIPTNATSGLRALCFVRQSDSTQLTTPTALTVV